MLKETATLSLKEGFIVLAMPDKEETDRCQAAVANVAHALRGCFDAEFPSFGIQRMWGVFQLDRDAWRRHVPPNSLPPSAEQKANMKKLLHMLGQTAADQHQALEEYNHGVQGGALVGH